jgi:outer membrane protein TolC
VPAAGRLPDLELKYEQWGVPLKRPYALNEADTLMVGLRQTFPAPGSLDAAERAAAEDARIALSALRAKQLDLIAQARRAYYEYHLADREYAIHLEHLNLTQRILELSRASFGAGGVSQQDVLQIELALRSVHRDLTAIERRKRSSTALLNALMGRPADAPLGPTPELEPREVRVSSQDLARLAEQRRPEIAAADHALERSKATVDRASSEAHWPSFMLGADYMYMPFAEAPHGYGAMAAINLPWLNAKHDDEVTVAERARAADERARAAVRVTVQFEVRDALAGHQAALQSYRIVKEDLLPAAQRSFEAAQAAFAAGRGSGLGLLDALRSLLLIRLDETRALVELASSAADLERAVGTDLEEAPLLEGAPHEHR